MVMCWWHNHNIYSLRINDLHNTNNKGTRKWRDPGLSLLNDE